MLQFLLKSRLLLSLLLHEDFMDKVPVEKVKEFEKDFLLVLKRSTRKVLDNFRAGKMDERISID